jgi:hypothetical protein
MGLQFLGALADESESFVCFLFPDFFFDYAAGGLDCLRQRKRWASAQGSSARELLALGVCAESA